MYYNLIYNSIGSYIIMINGELRELILQVIKSWQVIVVTVAVLLYILLVNYVSRNHYRARSSSTRLPKPKKVKAQAPAPEEAADDSELGLDKD